MSRQTKRNIIGLSIVTIIVVIVAALLYAVNSNALQREIAAWEAAGLTLNLVELMPPAPPEEENAAVAFLEIMAEVSDDVPPPTEEDAEGYLRKLGTDDEVAGIDSGESALSLAAVRFALPAKHLRDLLLADSPWAWPPSTYEDQLLPTSPRTLDASKILVLQARALAQANQVDEAGLYFQAALRLSEHIAMFPSAVSPIAHAGVDQIVLETLQDMPEHLAVAPLTEELQKRNYRSTLVRALQAEAALVWAQKKEWPGLYQSFTGVPLEPWGLGADAAHYFEAMREAIGRFDEPYLQQDDPQWEPDEGGGGQLSGALLPYLSGANRTVAEAEAHRRMALLALGLRRQKEALGSYEAALAKADIPVSPTTGERFEVFVDEGVLLIRTARLRGDEPLEWRWQ